MREEGSESLLFSQHTIDVTNTASLERSDSASLAFAVLQKLLPGINTFLDAEVIKTQVRENPPAQLRCRKYNCYSSVSGPNSNATEQLYLEQEKCTFLNMLFSHFLPVYPKPLPTPPPEALFTFSLRKTKQAACRIFYQIQKERRHVSYHALSQGTFLCEQRLLTRGGSMGLWQQTISGYNQQVALNYYHLVSRNSQYESTEATHRVHQTIKTLAFPASIQRGHL